MNSTRSDNGNVSTVLAPTMSVESPAINEPKEQNSVETLLFPRAGRSLSDSATIPVPQLAKRGEDSAKSGAKANVLHLAFRRSPRDSPEIVRTRCFYATLRDIFLSSAPVFAPLYSKAFSHRLGGRA